MYILTVVTVLSIFILIVVYYPYVSTLTAIRLTEKG